MHIVSLFLTCLIMGKTLCINEEIIKHRQKRRLSVRPVFDFNLSESDGVKGAKLFKLEKKSGAETFKIQDISRWVTVDTDGTVRAKEDFNYAELPRDKVISFWVDIDNHGVRNYPSLEYQQVLIHVTQSANHLTRDAESQLHFTNSPLPMQAIVGTEAPPGTTVYILEAKSTSEISDIRYIVERARTDRFEVDELTGVVRTIGSERFMLDMEYVLFVKAEDRNQMINGSFQSTPVERLSIVGGYRPPQFYSTKYEANIEESHEIDEE